MWCREDEAVLKEAASEVYGGRGGGRVKRLRRIEEYEKFLANCAKVRERMETERRGQQMTETRNANIADWTKEIETVMFIVLQPSMLLHCNPEDGTL